MWASDVLVSELKVLAGDKDELVGTEEMLLTLLGTRNVLLRADEILLEDTGPMVLEDTGPMVLGIEEVLVAKCTLLLTADAKLVAKDILLLIDDEALLDVMCK